MGLELLVSELASTTGKTTTPAIEDRQPRRNHNNNKTEVQCWHEIACDIQENASNAVTILNELLSYDKIETGSLKLEIGTVLIWGLVTKVVGQFKLQAVNKRIDMTLSITTKSKNTITDKPDEYDDGDLEAVDCSTNHTLRALVVMGDEMRLLEVNSSKTINVMFAREAWNIKYRCKSHLLVSLLQYILVG